MGLKEIDEMVSDVATPGGDDLESKAVSTEASKPTPEKRRKKRKIVIVDEHARLFGKFNVIDVVVTLVVLVAIFFFAVNFYRLYVKVEAREIYVTMQIFEQPEWFYHRINRDAWSPGTVITDKKLLDDGSILVKLKIVTLDFKYNGEVPLIGDELSTTVGNLKLKGIVINIEPGEEKNKYIIEDEVMRVVTVNVPSINKEFYESIKSGLISDSVESEEGVIITDIRSIWVWPDETVNVWINARVNVQSSGTNLYFQRKLLSEGSPLSFTVLGQQLEGEIIGIFEDDASNWGISLFKAEKIIELAANNIPVDEAYGLSKGALELDAEGNLVAEITEIQKYAVSELEQNLVLRLRVDSIFFNDLLFFKGKSLVEGTSLSFVGENGPVTGKVWKVYSPAEILSPLGADVSEPLRALKDQNKKVKLLVSGLQPYVAEAIPIGVVQKDSDGKINIIEILNKEIVPHEVVVTTASGMLVKQESPLLKNVVLTAKVLFSVSEKGELYFNGRVIKIGNKIKIATPLVEVEAIVTEFLEN